MPNIPRPALALLLATLATSLAAPPAARANGRPPNTTAIYPRADNPNEAILLTTFGLAVTVDSGLTWALVCEQAVAGSAGFLGLDPTILYSAGGVMTVGAFTRISYATDGGCTWQTPAPFAGVSLQYTAAALDPGNPQSWYITALNGQQGAVYRTQDGGATYAPLSLSVTNLNLLAIAALPAELIVLGSNSNSFAGPYASRSSDGGASWSAPTLIPGIPNGVSALSLWISAAQPQTWLFAATDAQLGTTQIWRSSDGGASASAVLTLGEAFNSFAGSADGVTVLVAGGSHIWRSTNGGVTFTQLPSPTGAACVAAGPSGLFYACGNQDTDGFSLALSRDQGSTWEPIFRLDHLQGPGICPAASSTGTACSALWPNQAAPIKAPVAGSPAGTLTLTGATIGGPSTAAPSSPAASAKKTSGGCQAAPPAPLAALAALAASRWLRRRGVS